MVRVCKQERGVSAHTKQPTICANDNKQLTKNRSGNLKHVSPLFCFAFSSELYSFGYIGALFVPLETKAFFEIDHQLTIRASL